MSAKTKDINPRLEALLGGEALTNLRQRLRQRFERAPMDGLTGSIRLSGLEEHEITVLAALTGRPARNVDSLQIKIDDVDIALARAGVATSLRDALERLDGPLVHRATEHAKHEAEWASVIDGTRDDRLLAFLATSQGVGLLRRLARRHADEAAALREQAETVLARLPAEGLPRAQLAAECLGDAHALDDGRPCASLVLAALRQQVAEEDTESRRAQWARAGVLVNELARPALFLNLPAEHLLAPPGEPGYLSLRRLMRSPPRWSVRDQTVYVCENPNIVAIAADQLGSDCAPLVCTDGMPAAAQQALLKQLADGGGKLKYHGDFDWTGLTIGNVVVTALGADPWRFRAEDYRAACATISRHAPRLCGELSEAAWDPDLAQAMQGSGFEVPEESVASSLLSDLAQ